MIKSFKHKGLEKFYVSGSKAGIIPDHAKRLRLQLNTLALASSPEDVATPGWFLHALHGKLEGHWSIRVNGNWRLTFCFEGGHTEVLDYQDYH